MAVSNLKQYRESCLRDGVKEWLEDKGLQKEQLDNTPFRFVRALEELFSGVNKDPKEALGKTFDENSYDELVIVRDIDFVSVCSHHLLPFIGKCHFAYLPNRKIVGLSKIPRLIETLSRRPQIQEKLSRQIVDTFQEVVQPFGCGVVIEANHLCMSIRGIKAANAVTSTIALTGTFKKNPSLKQEFLSLVKRST